MSQSVRKTSKKCHQVAKVCYGLTLSWKWVGCCHDKRWAIITFWWKISTLALLANNRSILTFYSGDIVFQMKISVSSSASTSSSSIFDPAQVYQTSKLWTVFEILTSWANSVIDANFLEKIHVEFILMIGQNCFTLPLPSKLGF